jgi:predicted secreted acid phosphatase
MQAQLKDGGMTGRARPLGTQAFRVTVLVLVTLALLIGYASSGVLQARDGPPDSRAHIASAARATIPNLTPIKTQISAYHDSGEWDADIYRVLRPAREYLLENLDGGGRPAIVFDIDDTLLSNYAVLKANDFGRVIPLLRMAIEAAAFPPIAGSVDLYRTAVANGVAVFLISGRAESLRAATERNLAEAGITDVAGMFLVPDDAPPAPTVVPFKSDARRRIAEQGYRILVNVGDQESDLAGGWTERTYKLPNPMYLIP